MIRVALRHAAHTLMLSSLAFTLACTSPDGGGARGEAAAEASLAPDELVVANAWVDVADDGLEASVYFVIQNRGRTTRTLVGARSAGCERGSIRRVVIDEGRMTSTGLSSLDVPAGGAVAFVPRGLFLQLECSDPLEDEGSVPITLELASGGSVSFEAEQRTP